VGCTSNSPASLAGREPAGRRAATFHRNGFIAALVYRSVNEPLDWFDIDPFAWLSRNRWHLFLPRSVHHLHPPAESVKLRRRVGQPSSTSSLVAFSEHHQASCFSDRGIAPPIRYLKPFLLRAEEGRATQTLCRLADRFRPNAKDIRFMTMLLPALANTDEAESDSGKRSKSVEVEGITCGLVVLSPPRRGLLTHIVCGDCG